MKKTLLAALLASLSVPVVAQTATQAPAAAPAAPAQAPAPRPDADPAMWVVRDDDTTIYLFGTFHLLDGRTEWFNDEVRTAFDASDEMVVEVKLPENPAEIQQVMAPLVRRLAIDPQGRGIYSRLNAAQVNALKGALGPAADAMDQGKFEPWFVAVQLAGVAMQRGGMTGEQGAEMVLKRAAAARNMPVGQLETVEEQFGFFDRVPEPEQIGQLQEALDDLEQMNAVLPRMLAAWNSGNAEQLDAVMNDAMNKYPAMRRVLLGARNERWAEWIDNRMDRPGTVFMAVGAGHLVGNDSVQTFLAQRNLRATRVPNTTPAR